MAKFSRSQLKDFLAWYMGAFDNFTLSDRFHNAVVRDRQYVRNYRKKYESLEEETEIQIDNQEIYFTWNNLVTASANYENEYDALECIHQTLRFRKALLLLVESPSQATSRTEALAYDPSTAETKRGNTTYFEVLPSEYWKKFGLHLTREGDWGQSNETSEWEPLLQIACGNLTSPKVIWCLKVKGRRPTLDLIGPDEKEPGLPRSTSKGWKMKLEFNWRRRISLEYFLTF